MLPVILGAAALGGALSAFSDSARSKEINERIRRAQALAAQGLVSQRDISNRLRSVDRMFNQRLSSVLNITALRTRGFANQGVIGAAAAGGVEGARLEAQSRIVSESQGINRQIRMSQAQMELGTETADPFGSFVSGAVSGAGVGIEASQLGGEIDVPEEAPGTGLTEFGQPTTTQAPRFREGGPITAGFGSGTQEGTYKTGLGTFESGLGGFKGIDDDEIYNFYSPTLWEKLGVRS